MERYFWICLGGAIGTGARHALASRIHATLGHGFPYGTLAVNALGSLALALLMAIVVETDWLSATSRLALTTGAMGGFTTFATFSWETMRLLQEGSWTTAAINVAGTLAACLAASFLGLAVGRWLVAGWAG